ncbi:hypothetical protein FOA52_000907 [Chlamydomonas sp. UWO 241]|nr:hypothetical protein FOA52_000907 [Chlamydomonas sp. UWO 241]
MVQLKEKFDDEAADLEKAAKGSTADTRKAEATDHYNKDREPKGPWSTKEERQLGKALEMFFAGTVDRYEQIATCMGGGRTAEDVKEKVQGIQAKERAERAKHEEGASASDDHLAGTSKPTGRDA